MRFDDMIATVLAQPSDRPDRLTAQWRQLVDLLAQRHRDADQAHLRRAYALLRAARGSIDAAVRQQAARSLAGRAVDPDLLAFFTEDSASVAAPLIAAARLEPQAWIGLLPRLGPAARALLRHREDLDPEVRHALAAFGRSDFVLEAARDTAADASGPELEAEHSESQIRELVARIEAYRKQRDGEHPGPEPALEVDFGPAEGFRWEASAEGLLVWVEGAPRGPLVGQSIAWIAGPGQFGVDGQAAGGFEKRAPFRDARFSVAGEGAGSGDWRISGIPFFDPAGGGFLGYRGTARRPRPDEVARAAAGAPGGVFGAHFPADSLRQLIHELRTPLNAIIGFAELIEGQHMGPAAAPYRGRAAAIMEQAQGLLGAVDDLDTAARIESKRLELDDSAVDAVALLCRLHQSYERLAVQRGSRIDLEIGEGLPLAQVEPAAAERMFARILAGTIGLASAGEAIRARLFLEPVEGRGMLCLAVDRPQAIDGLDEAALLDPGYSPEGDWPGAPALGLGFALRLVRNLAEAGGGSLRIEAAQFALCLPAVADAVLPAEKSEGSA